MQISSFNPTASLEKARQSKSADQGSALERSDAEKPELRKAFEDFVGQTFYSQMLSSMRKTVGKPAYFDGGQAEEIFRGQLDQVLAEKLSDASADKFAGPMYDLFALSRR
jgi:Rod binding domain-containing protein